jgi:hypothetical protein
LLKADPVPPSPSQYNQTNHNRQLVIIADNIYFLNDDFSEEK